jgi:UrcA family protein
MKIIAAATVIALSLATFSASMASTNETPRSRVVRFTDLDLSRLDGAASLYARLQGAARAVCGTPLSQRSVSDRLVYEECVDNSVRAAAAELDHDLLNEYVATKSR